MKIICTAPARSPEWFAARRGKITATRAANIMAEAEGLPGYKSRLQEWQDLKAELDGTVPVQVVDDEAEIEPEHQEFLDWGIDSEPLHRKKLGLLLGETLEPCNAVIQDAEYYWLCATPDVLTTGVRELKAVCGGAAMRKWAQGTPYAVQCQLAVQQRVTGLRDDGVVSAYMVRPYKPPTVQFERFDLTDGVEHFLLGALEGFWDSVQRDLPPPPAAADYEALRSAVRVEAGKRTKLPMELADRWRVMEAREEEMVKPFESEKDALKAEILVAMGDAEVGIFPDGTGFTLKGARRPRMVASGEYFITKPSLKFSEKAAWK